MPVTGTPPLAHGCQLTACLSLQRARVERFRFANGFCALESFRLAMIGRADRREELSATLIGTRTLAPAKPVDGEVRHATSPLRGSRGRTGARLPVRLFSFGSREASPRPRRSNITPRLAAWACRIFPRLHRAETCAACLAPSLGTVPPAAWPDSPAFRPLHFTTANRCADAIVSFRRSKTGETG